MPLFSVWQKSHYDTNLTPTLRTEVGTALKDERFKQVTFDLDHLDVILKGQVADLKSRSDARKISDDLSGARAREQDNHIQVYPKLELSRNKGHMSGSGWLQAKDKQALKEWLKGDSLNVATLKDHPAIIGLNEQQRDYAGRLVKGFFALPGDRSLSLDLKHILLKGDVTQFQLDDWQEHANGWFNPDEPAQELTLHPSIYHFPGYSYQTAESGDATKNLAATLQDSPIYFALASHTIAEEEMGKVRTIAEAILQSEAQTEFIVGGHTDNSGTLQANLVLGKARAEQVIAALIQLGIGPEKFLIQNFGPSLLAGDNQTEEGRRLSRRVEILIK